jgi:hypothetical protein
MEAGSNISTEALRVIEGDEKGTQCLGLKLGHPVLGVYKYGVLALQVVDTRVEVGSNTSIVTL